MKTIQNNLEKTKKASFDLVGLSLDFRNKIIKQIGDEIFNNRDLIVTQNKKDLEQMDKNDPMYDRLLLNYSRIEQIRKGCYDLAKIKDPLDKYQLEDIILKDGLSIKKVGVPLGVVACIYEARPNVTIDIIIMGIKSQNAVVLRGGSKAKNSNDILINIVQNILEKNNLSKNIVYNYPTERDKLGILYNAVGLVDVIIPRGGKQLINSVRKNSLVPVIETGAGVVHLYLDDKIKDINRQKAIDVIINAKISRPSVCNALDTLIINKNLEKEFIELLFDKLKKSQVNIIENVKDYHKEQLSLDLNIKYVETIDEAIKHIQKYSSKHSDGILSDNEDNILKFNNSIDSSVVYTNTSTRFSDGACFGFGGEIGISTQKLHARGPMGAESLVTYKYLINSSWKIR